MADEEEDIFQLRSDALEEVLGPMDEEVRHATIPFQMGYDIGGSPHIYYFSNHLPGVISVTAGMIGTEQRPSDAGNFEFMMAFREKNEFGERLMCPLSYYPQEASINSGETMGLPPQMTEGTNLAGIIFDCYRTFKVGSIDAGLMVIIGITQAELDFKLTQTGRALIEKLKENDVYPYTELDRQSVV